MNAGQKEYCQCTCGFIHKEDLRNYNIIDDIYVTMKCPRCRGETNHLLCGENEEDIYLYYDVVKDQRYY